MATFAVYHPPEHCDSLIDVVNLNNVLHHFFLYCCFALSYSISILYISSLSRAFLNVLGVVSLRPRKTGRDEPRSAGKTLLGSSNKVKEKSGVLSIVYYALVV